MTRAYKRPGYIRAGFEYQDLQAIEVLINFYRDQHLYEWVELDSEDNDFRSVDDIVAYRKDKRFDLLQVKFTPRPDDEGNQLTWDWLCAKKPKGKSMLRKWAETVLSHHDAGTLNSAALKTDRIPSPEFESCLRGNKIDPDLLPGSLRSALALELGSEEKLCCFFGQFEFLHSLPHTEELETRLWERIAHDTDELGWYAFRSAVQRWSVEKKQPEPDGRIRHFHLSQVFATERPSKMPQGFDIPRDYQVPETTFAEAFFNSITTSDGVSVLWAPPGRGKSTFLSYCTGQKADEVVFIRHHYFLSARARSADRFHYNSIYWSLRTQLDQQLDGTYANGKNLAEVIQNAASYLKELGKRLVVIIDGVDHVWRENRSHEHLEQLFSELLPISENAHLVVGTQAIADEFLPAKLLNAHPRKKWSELPAMSQEAVKNWTTFQIKAKRLILKRTYLTRSEAVGKIAHSLHDISDGLPLHLIYSFEALIKSGRPITQELVRSLPSCPSGDIRDYYRALWGRISAKAKIVLHVLAGFDFGLPPGALPDCFGGETTDFQAYAEFSHLLDDNELEVLPFHASLFAFVRDLDDHKLQFQVHGKVVPKWLEEKAPSYWKWAWTWVAEAIVGTPARLLSHANRSWAILSLANGYPITQITQVLEQAEYAALSEFDLPKLLELRMVKTRTLNGPEFQTNEWPLFVQTTLSASTDQYLSAVYRSRLSDLDPTLLGYLVRTADAGIGFSLVDRSIDELNSRLKAPTRDGQNVSQFQTQVARGIMSVVAHQPRLTLSKLVTFAKQFSNRDELMGIFARECRISGAYDKLFQIGLTEASSAVSREIFTALCEEGIEPTAKGKLKNTDAPRMVLLSLVMGNSSARPSHGSNWQALFEADENDADPTRDRARPALYDIFLRRLINGMSRASLCPASLVPEAAQETWLGDTVTQFELAADFFAAQWHREARLPTLSEIYEALDRPNVISGSYHKQRQFIAARLAVRDIAVDLSLISKAGTPPQFVSRSEISDAAESGMWLDELWLDEILERYCHLHDADGAAAIIERVGVTFDTKVFEFNERTDLAVKLSAFSDLYGQKAAVSKYLLEAADCLLGYGWRKDPFAGEVLDALEELIDTGHSDCVDVLVSLTPQYERLTDYTDGDGTRHARTAFYKAIGRVRPELSPAIYADLIRKEDWYYAEAAIEGLEIDNINTDATSAALLATHLDDDTLVRSIRSQDAATLAVAEQVLDLNGTNQTQLLTPPAASSDTASTERKTAEIDPSHYPPGQLKAYWSSAEDGHGFHSDKAFTTRWLEHWANKGRATDALSELEKETFDSGRYMGSDLAFDGAFAVALKYQGRTAAYPWLVRAHDNSYGWLNWMTSEEEAFARMDRMLANYPEKWKQFIIDTANSKQVLSERPNNLTIGFGRLIHFLLRSGQAQTAKECALSMVAMFKDETNAQPLTISPTTS